LKHWIDKFSTGREEEINEKERDKKARAGTYSNVVFPFVVSVLALAGSGQKLRTKRLWTESVAGIDEHCVVVREKRHRVGRGS
jgi:hypothetical protein